MKIGSWLFLTIVATFDGLAVPSAGCGQGRIGLHAEIIEARIGADRRPVVTVKLSDGNSRGVDLADVDAGSVKFTLAALRTGKNGESAYFNYVLNKVSGKEFVYKNQTRQPALMETLQPDVDRGGTLKQIGPGTLKYVFGTILPAGYERNATHVIGGELTRGRGRFVANPLFEFVPSGAKIKGRRAVVETATCNNCHDPLKHHGGTRQNVGYCALCHTPQLTDPESGESLEFRSFVHKIHHGKLLPSVKAGNPFFLVGAEQKTTDHHAAQTDEEKRKAAKGPMPPVNVHYKRLIHRIHTGAAAGESFIVYGGTPAKPGPVELGDIRFPGDRRNCVKCHVPGANEPPLPAGLLPSLIPQADGTVKALQPITSVCMACHTKETAKIHVDTMTAQNGQEACVTCHGVGRTFAVEKVHRR